MRNRILIGGCLVAVASAVSAQGSNTLGVSVRAGQFKPQGEAARNLGETWAVGGLDVNVRQLKRGKEESFLFASVDVASKGDFSTIPVCLNYAVRNKKFYFFGGLGASFTTVPRIVGSQTEESDSIELAYQFGIGYDFEPGKSPFFAELKYLGNGEDKLSAFAIMVGVRL